MMELLTNRAIMPAIKKIQHMFFDKPNTRQDILNIESWVKSLKTNVDISCYPLYQYLENGLYTREIHMPAGHMICSRIHKDDYFIAILKGKAWVINEFENRVVLGPCAFTIKGGAKNILFILEDMVWIDTHNVKAKELKEAEKEIFVETYDELEKYQNIINEGKQCQAQL